MIVIVAVLRKYDNQPNPQWSLLPRSSRKKATLTVNGFVSLFATLSKAFMLVPVARSISQLKWLWFHRRYRPLIDLEDVDGASRGVMGSTTFLFLVFRKKM